MVGSKYNRPTPFEKSPQISYFALSKYVAALAATMASTGRMPWMGTHEPNLQSYMSGANMITAETGVNPRDTASETSGNRGWDVIECKKMLKEAGYKYFARGDGSRGEL
ncbi:MAG: hypothetical protein ACI4KL_03150 [Lentihominibacter sp.]